MLPFRRFDIISPHPVKMLHQIETASPVLGCIAVGIWDTWWSTPASRAPPIEIRSEPFSFRAVETPKTNQCGWRRYIRSPLFCFGDNARRNILFFWGADFFVRVLLLLFGVGLATLIQLQPIVL